MWLCCSYCVFQLFSFIAYHTRLPRSITRTRLLLRFPAPRYAALLVCLSEHAIVLMVARELPQKYVLFHLLEDFFLLCFFHSFFARLLFTPEPMMLLLLFSLLQLPFLSRHCYTSFSSLMHNSIPALLMFHFVHIFFAHLIPCHQYCQSIRTLFTRIHHFVTGSIYFS